MQVQSYVQNLLAQLMSFFDILIEKMTNFKRETEICLPNFRQIPSERKY